MLSYAYQLPHPGNISSFAGKALGGWTASGVTTIQSGHRLTAVIANPTNAYGIPNDRPDYVPGCSINKTGSVQSRVTEYFNTACFANPPLIANNSDGVATDFGNSPIGNIDGPSEVDFDFAVAKLIPLRFPKEGSTIEFRSEFYNLFNHPIFNDPSTAFGPGTGFGEITGPTVVSPRVIQFALKYKF